MFTSFTSSPSSGSEAAAGVGRPAPWAVGPPALDLASGDDEAVYRALAAAAPDAIINAAAHTAETTVS